MMLTTTASVDLVNLSMANAGIVALLGYAVVFFGLILLMLVLMVMGKIFVARDKKLAEKAAAKEAEMASVPVAPHTKGAIVLEGAPKAPGTAGSLKLHDVDPKTAAMIMAIVANRMGKPLNELRFTSIKEVK
ncbi:MAG: OadG family transporter subunit [Faecousia sp.]